MSILGRLGGAANPTASVQPVAPVQPVYQPGTFRDVMEGFAAQALGAALTFGAQHAAGLSLNPVLTLGLSVALGAAADWVNHLIPRPLPPNAPAVPAPPPGPVILTPTGEKLP